MLKITDCRLEHTVFTPAQLVETPLPKILFAGRSNVGKSTLINKLMGRKRLARTSSKPGKTISINYYRLNDSFYFVDLPGYGFARIPPTETQRVNRLMTAFFNHVQNAKLLVLLIDSRRGFLEADLQFISRTLDKKIKLLTVLTKSDKLSSSKLISQKQDLQNQFGLNVLSFTVKSSENAVEILKHINKALTE